MIHIVDEYVQLVCPYTTQNFLHNPCLPVVQIGVFGDDDIEIIIFQSKSVLMKYIWTTRF